MCSGCVKVKQPLSWRVWLPILSIANISKPSQNGRAFGDGIFKLIFLRRSHGGLIYIMEISKHENTFFILRRAHIETEPDQLSSAEAPESRYFWYS